MEKMGKGILYIVATPIGNLEDMTLRAIRILKEVDLIACEDTRVSRKLLDRFEIKKPLVSLHQHSSDQKISEIINCLNQGQNVAYITDGGTPGISDPGQALVKAVQDTRYKIQLPNKSQISSPKKLNPNSYNLKIIPIPGASAVVAAISVSGLIEKEFYFAGFLPKKKGRQTKFNQLKNMTVPIVIYESALRLEKTLNDIKQYFGGDAEVFIAREMTKLFEEYWGGKVLEVLTDIQSHKLKGEIVLLIKSS